MAQHKQPTQATKPNDSPLGAPRFGRVLKGTIHTPVLKSRILAGAKFAEPLDRELLVYVPPSYDADKDRLPVVTMLPAFGASHRSALGYSPWKPNTFERLEALILAGECPPAILVVPDVMTRWGGGQFVDSATSGRWQSFLAEELIPFVDNNFRTIPEASGRGVVGRSSGGFGALRLAMDRPGLVSAVASHAGDASFEISMRPMLTGAAVAFREGIEAFAKRIDARGPKTPFDFDGLSVLACSAAYAPNGAATFPHCDLPIRADGSLEAEAWQSWLAHDPARRIPESAKAMAALSLVFIDAGEDDEHGLQFAAAKLRDALMAVDAPVEYEEHVGGHRGTSWRYEVSLPKIIRSLRS